MDDGLPEVLDAKRVTYNPDDVIVLRCSGRISQDQASQMEARLRTAFPTQELLILDSALTLDVIAPAEAGA